MFNISVQNVSKSFSGGHHDQPTIDHLSIDIPAGTSLGIMGKSGAGKSTLIRMLNYLEKPDSGRIVIQGQDLAQLTATQLRKLRQKIGMIFQHYPLVQTRTVYDNIALPLVLAKQPAEQIHQTVSELLELVNLSDRIHHTPKQLSGGQQQRVAIARALAADPELILADEMTSALDPETTEDILALFQSIQKKRAFTLVVVAHDARVIRALCQQMAVLDQGKLTLQSSDTLSASLLHPTLQRITTGGVS